MLLFENFNYFSHDSLFNTNRFQPQNFLGVVTLEEQPATVEINDDNLLHVVGDSKDEDGQKDEANENDDDDESNDELGEDDCGTNDIARDIEEFDEKEDTVFSSEDYERLSCFAHTLQLVVSKFDEVRACKEAIKRAKKLVTKINKSVKATEMLKKLSGIKLLGDCPTRWSSTFLLLEQLLQVRDCCRCNT